MAGGVLTAYEERERDGFGSRIAFYMSAVGSAVGFGNVWRFPGLCAGFGGSAFLIPYAMALVLIGIPMLFLEIGLGQFYQTGDVGVFGSFNVHLRGIGVCSVIAGYVLLTYYAVLIAWVFNAFFDSFGDEAPWEDPSLDGDAAFGYFVTKIAGVSNMPTMLIGANVGYAALTWFIVFAAIAFGSKLTGQITYVTMGLPIGLLFLFLFRGIGLDGASDGIELYVGKRSDITVLGSEPTVWTEAVTQIFFSLSVTFGTMTAYGSLVPRTEPAFLNSMVVACANCSFSFIAGFAVFSSIGHLAYLKGVDVSQVNFRSFGLVFGTWPVVLASLPGGIHWVRLMFLNLILLGIDSAFSILEGVTTVMKDTSFFKDTPKWIITGIFSFVGFLTSFLYTNDSGLLFLDAIDYYINFMLLLVGFMESFSAGWMYNMEGQIKKVGLTSVLLFVFANFGSIIVLGSVWFGAKEWLIALIVALLMYIVFAGAAVATGGEGAFSILYFQNIMELRDEMQPVIGWVPSAWGFLMRHFIPQVLLLLFINGTTAKLDNGKSKFGNYSGYEKWPYQILGILSVVVIAVAFLAGVAYPPIYKDFAIYENSCKKATEEEPKPGPMVESEAVEKVVDLDKGSDVEEMDC